MNKKFDKVDLDTGKHYLEDIDASLVDALIKSGNAISVLMDYEANPNVLRVHFDNRPGEGIVVLSNQAYLDHESVFDLDRGTDDEFSEISFEKLSTGVNDCIALDIVETNPDYASQHHYNSHEHFFVHGDPNYYFVVKLEAEWGVASSDNDRSIDFTNNPVFCQLFSKSRSEYISDVSLWTKLFSKRFDYTSGNTISINEEFIIEADVPTYLGFNLCHTDDTLFDFVTNPIANFQNFWKRITVTRRKKTSWFKTYAIPSTDYNGISIKTGDIPTPAQVGLPFKGWYEVHTKVTVREGITVGDYSANLDSAQTFELRPKGGSYTNIDESIRHVSNVDDVDIAVNKSLQGSMMIEITDNIIANRKIQFKVNLPNGYYKQLVGGYMHIKYKGKSPGLDRT